MTMGWSLTAIPKARRPPVPAPGATETQGREDTDSDAIRTGEGGATIELREEFFDGVQRAWRTDGYVLVSDHADAADGHQYERNYGAKATGIVAYDVPDPMGAQRGGDAGLVNVPRAAITGKLWNDSAKGSDSADTYNGIQDEGEPGLANEVVLITQWYYDPTRTNSADNNSHWFQNTQFGLDRYTSNRDGAYVFGGTKLMQEGADLGDGTEQALAPIVYNGNDQTPLQYVYADANGNRGGCQGQPVPAWRQHRRHGYGRRQPRGRRARHHHRR